MTLPTDGVEFSQSRSQNGGWRVWFAVAQLPPKLRFSARNTTPATLFVEPGTPPCNDLVPLLEMWFHYSAFTQELEQPQILELGSRLIRLSFKVIMIVCDLIGKASVLNMYENNGFFGCHYCTAKVVPLDRKHCYYPFRSHFEKRSREFHAVAIGRTTEPRWIKVEHGRQFRGLKHEPHFKASEYFNYMFYAGVIFMKDRIPDNW